MGNIKLGEGQIDVKGVFDALKAIKYEGGTTMEIFGPETVMASAQILQDWDTDGSFVIPTLRAKKAVLV
jgi:sugar phosphate isomerase/epimerase